MSSEEGSFLSRWSRRKFEAQREKEQAEQARVEPPAPAVPVAAPVAEVPVTEAAPAPAPAVELPPLDSLDGLRSDYVAFMGQDVNEDIKRSALKKLFGDPHFNQMDGLDTYIDDYTQFEPLPKAMRLTLKSAQDFLLDSEKAEIAAANAAAAPPAASNAGETDMAEVPADEAGEPLSDTHPPTVASESELPPSTST